MWSDMFIEIQVIWYAHDLELTPLQHSLFGMFGSAGLGLAWHITGRRFIQEFKMA